MSMVFYKRFPGAYLRKTSHLTLVQHGAYIKLLDHYYSTGRPLPDSVDSLCRIAGAHTEEERAAVVVVADEFFPEQDGVRYNDRAEEELRKAAERSKKASSSARKRWDGR